MKNLKDFMKDIREIRIQPDEELHSHDVSAFFTSVPVDKALDVIREKLEEDQTLQDRTSGIRHDIIRLLRLCLKCMYFLFQGEYYLQINGAAMGSPVSLILCNLYMEYFEKRALAMARHPPRLWRCYVDETYTIMKKAHTQEFTEYLNTVDPDIKWTMEGEVETVVTEDAGDEVVWDRVEKALAFLDTWSVIFPDGSIKTKVFRKETHTNQYLNFGSNHPL